MNNVDIKDKSKEILEKINVIKGCLDKLIGDKESLISKNHIILVSPVLKK